MKVPGGTRKGVQRCAEVHEGARGCTEGYLSMVTIGCP